MVHLVVDPQRDLHHVMGRQQQVLIDYLYPIAQMASAQRTENASVPTFITLEPLSRYDAAAGMSVANIIRSRAGGQLLDPETICERDNDPVKYLLCRMALDAFPILLAPADNVWHGPHLSFYNHPDRVTLQSELRADVVLAKLFPEEDEGLGHRGMVYNSLGRGGTFQDVMFGEIMIGAAWNILTMRTDSYSLLELMNVVASNVDKLRLTLSGSHAEVDSLLVFTGLTMANEARVETPWGVLRTLTTSERKASPPSLEGSVSGTDHEGKSVTVSYAGEIVLDSAVPYSLVIRSWVPSKGVISEFPKFPDTPGSGAVTRRLEAIQLATLLAVDRPPGSWVNARLAWHWTADPLAHGRVTGWNDVRTSPGFMPYELSDDDCRELAAWLGRINDHWVPQIDIAVRRFISAAHSRTDPADRLVDSVIAWENLFGTSEGEPRFRVTSAMACLLEAEGHSRISTQSRLKRLYDARSRVVHGARIDTPSLIQDGNDALLFARQSLQGLFRDRPDLLHEPDGAGRSAKLVLGV